MSKKIAHSCFDCERCTSDSEYKTKNMGIPADCLDPGGHEMIIGINGEYSLKANSCIYERSVGSCGPYANNFKQR